MITPQEALDKFKYIIVCSKANRKLPYIFTNTNGLSFVDYDTKLVLVDVATEEEVKNFLDGTGIKCAAPGISHVHYKGIIE